MTIAVETSLQKQIDEIGYVRIAFQNAVSGRGSGKPSNAPLYDLVYQTDNPAYMNSVLGSTLLNLDVAVNAATVGPGLFNSWFTLQNAYFNANNKSYPDNLTPSNKVTTLANAVQNYFRWRVSQDFNQCMLEVLGSNGDIQVQNVYPSTSLTVASYTLTSSSAGTFTAGSNSDPTLTGPGVISISPSTGITIGGASVTLSVTCSYESGASPATAAIAVTVPSGATSSTSTQYLGRQAITGCTMTTGVITMAATSQFQVGQKVLVASNSTFNSGTISEVAQVLNINAGVSITVGKCGQTTAGLRPTSTYDASLSFSGYTSSGYVFPLFTGITGVTNSTGTAADAVTFKFQSDRPQVLNP